MSSEYVIRASGADKAALKTLVARFPLAFRPDPRCEETAHAPELKRPGESWVMGQMEEAEAKPGGRGLPGQWVLEERSGRPRFMGQPEGGLRDTGAGYFLLMKGKGTDFIATPVSDIFTFKPSMQRRHQSLEEAEAAMQAQRLQHGRANPRLAKAVARDDDDPLVVLREEDEVDSDEEWKDIKERAAARQVVKTAPQQQQQQRKQATAQGAGDDDERLDEDHAERPAEGEDWEHEDFAADDDLDMGEGDDEADASSPVRTGGFSDSEEDDGALQPEKAKRRLKRMMRETGLEDSEEEGSEEEGGDEESESIMDEEDLDRMAGGAAGSSIPSGRAREPTPETQPRPAPGKDGAVGGGKKRKSPTPPAAAAAKPAPAPAPAAPGAEHAAKRPRTGISTPAGTAAAVTAQAECARLPPDAPNAVPTTSGGVITVGEIRRLIRTKPRMTLSDLASNYRSQLSSEAHKQLSAMVKSIARLEKDPSGSKYLVLKE